jgi:hypothetical protein
MQSMQIPNPHRHRQQNGKVFPQQWQSPEAAFRRRCRYDDSFLFNPSSQLFFREFEQTGAQFPVRLSGSAP